MALALEGANSVWNRVKIATAGQNAESGLIFKALKSYLATQGKNPKLQYVAIDGSINSSDSGNTAAQILLAGACRIYALYLIKRGTTAAWFKGSDHATTAATDGTQAIAEHDANAVAGDEIIRIWTDGKSLANGLTVTEDTTATGSTLTLLANRYDGFVILGSA